MSVNLSPEVLSELASGRYGILVLVKFEFPGNPVGYFNGPRPLPFNGFTYQPSKYLEAAELIETVDIDLGEREVIFSDVPAADNNLLNGIEEIEYTNAPAVVTKLLADTKRDEVLGLLETTFYEVSHIVHEMSEEQAGLRNQTLTVVLKEPGQTGRERANTVRSLEEHQFDFDATDRCYEFVATVHNKVRKFGQIRR